MVQIDYINGDSETVETTEWGFKHFTYDKWTQMFIVFTSKRYGDHMQVPREFVKSIRHIEVE